jgi:hypothetical protein
MRWLDQPEVDFKKEQDPGKAVRAKAPIVKGVAHSRIRFFLEIGVLSVVRKVFIAGSFGMLP